MKPTTIAQLELIIRKFIRQLKKKDSLSVNEIITLSRLVSSCNRLSRSSGTTGRPPEMTDEEAREYMLKHGNPDFYAELEH